MTNEKIIRALPSRLADNGRVHFGAGVGILPRKR